MGIEGGRDGDRGLSGIRGGRDGDRVRKSSKSDHLRLEGDGTARRVYGM